MTSQKTAVNMLNCELLSQTPKFYVFGNITVRGARFFKTKFKVDKKHFPHLTTVGSQFSIYIPQDVEITCEGSGLVPKKIIAWKEGFGKAWEVEIGE